MIRADRTMLADGTVLPSLDVEIREELRRLGITTGAYQRAHPYVITKIGKKAAGRELDGRTWDEFPAQAGEYR